jgi:hypothetical protein
MNPHSPARILVVSVVVLLSLAACTSPVASPTAAPTSTSMADVDAARQALLGFLESLNQGRFEDAAQTYAGDYEAIRVFDTAIPIADHLALLRNACVSSNLRCLAPKGAVLKQPPAATEFVFLVEFNNPDGTLFTRGPCCGATETEMPPQSAFEFRVVRANGGRFSILDLPPYVP